MELARRQSETNLSMAAHFFLLKLAPFALIFDHKTLKCVWVRHLERGLRLN